MLVCIEIDLSASSGVHKKQTLKNRSSQMKSADHNLRASIGDYLIKKFVLY